MNQPGTAFLFFHPGERKSLWPEVCCKNSSGRADRQPKSCRSGDQLGSSGRDDSSSRQNRGVAPRERRAGAGRCSKVCILKHQSRPVHYENCCIHLRQSPREAFKVGKNPVIGNRFAEDSPFVLVMKFTGTRFEV